MAREILTIAGQAIGYSLGGPLGAVVGSFIGGTIGNIIDPLDPVYGPRLEDRRIQVASYGTPVGRLYGVTRTAGCVIWAADLEEVESSEQVGGKGGPSQEVVSYTYFATFAVLLSENEIRSIRRIWADAVLIHDGRLEVDNPGAARVDYTLYRGTEDQLPDPTMEAALGVGEVPAYRGYAYLVFNRLPVSRFGNRIPSMTFEVVGSGDFTETFPATSMGSTHSNTWDYMRLRSDGYLLLVERVNTTTATVAVANPQTGALEDSETFTLGTSCALTDALYVPPTNEFWLLGYDGASSYVWRIDAATLTLVEKKEVDNPFADQATVGNAGLIGYYDAKAQAVNVYRTSQFLTNAFRQLDLDGERVGDAVDGPTNFPERFVGGGTYCVIMIGNDVASAIQPVGEEVTTYDPGTETYTTEIVGQGTVLATQVINNSAAAAYDNTRSRYLVFDQSESLWWVEDSETPTFDFIRTVSGTSTYSPSSEMVYVEGIDAFVYVKNDGTLWVFDGETADTVLDDVSVPSGGPLPSVRPSPIDAGAVIVAGGSTGDNVVYEKILRATTVGDAVADLSDASGYDAADYDVSELTQRLRGYRVSQVGPKRQAIEQLGAVFFFDGCEQDDQIVYKLRGRASSATFTEDDCIVDGAELPIKSSRAQESSLPRRMVLTSPDPFTDHQQGSQNAERQAVQAGQDEVASVDVVLTADENKRVVDARIFDRWASRTTAQVKLTLAAVRLTGGDVITVEDRRYRVVARNFENFALSFDLVADDADVVDQVSSGVQGSWDGQTVRLVVATDLTILDTSLLRDAENDPGAYWAAWGIAPHWRGAVLYTSTDNGVTWQSIGSMPTPGGSVGTATTELGDWTGGNVFDEANTVTVKMRNGVPSSVTRAQVLTGANAAAIRSGALWEIIQYRTATDNGDGTYTLSGLLRGRRGTEHAIAGHAVGDDVVLLSASLIRDFSLDIGELGTERLVKAVSIGATIEDTASQIVTINGERLVPWSPVDLRAARNVGTNDITLTWKRRTRLRRRFTGTGGIYVPLGEDSEAYEVRIYTDGTYTTVARTISGLTAATTTYTSAQQTTDFGSPQSTVYVRVYQSSAEVGLGHALEAAA